MLPIKAVSFGMPAAAPSRVCRSSQTDAMRRFRRAGRIAAATLIAVVLALVGASAAAAALLAYVSNATKELVLPINLTTNAVEAGIEVKANTSSIAIPLSGALSSLAYAPSFEFIEAGLLTINTKTNSLLGTIALESKKPEPEAVAITPNGLYAYVVYEEFNVHEGAVAIFDLATNTLLLTIKVGNEPEGIAFTLDGELAYVTDKANEAQGQVTVIENASNPMSAKVKETINIGTVGKGSEKCLPEGQNPAGFCEEPEKIAISPEGKLAFVADGAAGLVTVINIPANTVAGNITVGLSLVSNNEPDNVVITSSGNLAYVADGLLGTIVPIEIKNGNKVAASISVGGLGLLPNGLALTADGSLLVVTDEEGQNVKAIDTAKNTVKNTYLDLGEPNGVAITP